MSGNIKAIHICNKCILTHFYPFRNAESIKKILDLPKMHSASFCLANNTVPRLHWNCKQHCQPYLLGYRICPTPSPSSSIINVYVDFFHCKTMLLPWLPRACPYIVCWEGLLLAVVLGGMMTSTGTELPAVAPVRILQAW